VDDDPRSDELLEEHGRLFWRLNAAVAWTDGISNDTEAKACSRGGRAAWKAAKPLREQAATEDGAAAYFRERARKRNPAVVASASGWDLVEYDGDQADLNAKHEVPTLPLTLGWRSRRGPHLVYRAPPGATPMKVQVDESGVLVASDGYLIAAPSLRREYGVVYELNGTRELATLPDDVRELLLALGDQARAQTRRAFETGELIPEGNRSVAIFWRGVELLRNKLTQREALERLLDLNREQCRPPLPAQLVEKQLRGAARFVGTHPTETERARAEARRALDAHRVGAHPVPSARKRVGLFLPFVDVRLSGPPRWLWRGRVPEGAVTLVAGRPKLGKSLFAIWLAAQLSRGTLDGTYADTPAKTLIVAAEDPVDPIVKGRLIAAAADQAQVGTLVQGRQDRQGSPRESVGGLGGLDGAGALARRITIPDEYELLEEIVVENQLALVVLDPINSFLSSRIDAHRDAEIRRVLDPLAHLAARRGFAALAVVHLNRRSDTDVLNRITGSGGYGGSARSVLTFGRHPESDTQRVVAAEGNWQKEAQSDVFELREVIVFPDAEPNEQAQPALVHVGGSELQSGDLIDELLDDRGALDEAKDYLRGELAFGPVAVAELRRGAEANALAWRTVERAKRLLGVEARRLSSAGPRGSGRWEWSLELVEAESDEEHS
jgi:AAA domain/Bifunctional DNA primase/polymerase, N-terminal